MTPTLLNMLRPRARPTLVRFALAILILGGAERCAVSPPTVTPPNAATLETPAFSQVAPSPPVEAATPTILVEPTATLGPPPEHRIGVRVLNGVSEFYDRVNGAKFNPRGSNLWRWKQLPRGQDTILIDTMFNTQIGQLDSALAELPRMAAEGFNAVRVWSNACWGGAPGCMDRAAGGLDMSYLKNLAHFIRAAKENGIYVILTMDELPNNGGYRYSMNTYRGQFDGFNLEFMTQGGIDGERSYYTDMIRGLREAGAPTDAILAYELKNEAFFEAQLPPLSQNSGEVKVANGKTYNLADSKQRRRLMEESWVYYIEQVAKGIKSVDPTALVTMGFFVQQEPNRVRVGDTRIVYLDQVLNESALDFVDLHAYPGYDLTMSQHAENFSILGYNKKPLVLGEFGADRGNFPDIRDAALMLQSWQVASCAFGFDGWLMWTWGGGDVKDDYWEAVEKDGAISRALAPARNPNPCAPGAEMKNYPNLAFGKPVKTSRTLGPLYSGAQAVDLSLKTQWNAGGHPPQWIEIDLQKPSAIRLIRLVVGQDPPGETVHRVLGKGASDSYRLLHEFRGVTRSEQVLEFTPPQAWQGIRFVRVETETSPSWVAWEEIQVIAP